MVAREEALTGDKSKKKVRTRVERNTIEKINIDVVDKKRTDKSVSKNFLTKNNKEDIEEEVKMKVVGEKEDLTGKDGGGKPAKKARKV